MSLSESSLPRRVFFHQELVFCATNVGLALVFGGCKKLFLSHNNSYFGKIPSLFACWFGYQACQYAYQAVQFYNKRRFLIEPSLNLSIEKNQAAFETAFSKLQSKISLFFLFIGPGQVTPPTLEEQKQIFKSLVSHGTCAGQAEVLLQEAKKNPNASAQELLRACQERVADVFYRQMLDIASADLKVLKDVLELNRASATMVAGIDYDLNNVTAEIGQWTETKDFAIQSPLSYYEGQFRAFFESSNSLPFFEGSIRMETAATFANGRYRFGHRIFIQKSQGLYRFFDPINFAEGFYEFKDKTQFLATLRSQVLGDVGPQASVRFTRVA